MNRFYRGDDLVVDLEAVSCVAGDAIIVGGVRMALRESVATAIRKQFVLYKENRDKENFDLKKIIASRLYNLSWAAGLFGARLHSIGLVNAERHAKQIAREQEGVVNGK